MAYRPSVACLFIDVITEDRSDHGSLISPSPPIQQQGALKTRGPVRNTDELSDGYLGLGRARRLNLAAPSPEQRCRLADMSRVGGMKCFDIQNLGSVA